MKTLHKRLLQGLGAVLLLVLFVAVLLWSVFTGQVRMADGLSREAVETEGDALSALLIVRSVARTAGSPEGADDVRPGEPPPPPEPGIDRLREQIAAEAYRDWRVLALLSHSHPADPPLPADTIRERLLASAGDNAYVHMIRLGRWAHCCRSRIDPEALAAAKQASRYEHPRNAMIASLEHRYRQVPPSRFSWGLALLSDTSSSPTLAFVEVEGATGHNEWTTTCDQAEGELAEACRHLATLVLRDAVWSHDVLEAVAVMEQVGTSSDRADAAARERDVDWLAINVGKTIRDESALINEPRYALAAFGDMEAMRALLRAGGIATRPPADWTPSSEQ